MSRHDQPLQDRRRRRIAVVGFAVLLLWAPVTAVAASAAEPVPDPPPGVAITVGGLPMTGGEGGKIAECTISVVVSGLPEPADPPTEIGLTITAVPPAVPEGSPLVLVDESDTTTGAIWTRDVPMDDLVAPLARHGNGYHLRVAVTLDGALAGSSVYWLGCGEPQSGNPTRVQFEVQWVDRGGTARDEAPLPALGAGWQDAFRLEGTSQKGTAVCTYAPGSGVLTCTYDNPGHGDRPGLVVPGNPRAEYVVEVTGVPAGWTAATTTLGTFVGRERCPRGGGHDGGEGGHDGGEGGHDGGEGGHDGGEGGHDGDVGVLAADGGDDGHGGGPRDCVHAVVLVQDPAPPPAEPPAEPPVGPPGPVVAAGSLTPAASTATTAGASTAATPGASTAASGAVLPETGAPSVPLAGVGVALLGLGGLLSGWSRRRRALVTARARSMERARALAAVRPIP